MFVCRVSDAVCRVSDAVHRLPAALTPTGEHTQWTAGGWAARALQHEMDHLSGTLLLDRCSPRSLEHQHWQTINTRAGRYIQNYGGYRDRQWGWFW